MLNSVNSYLNLGEKIIKKQSRIVSFVNSRIKQNDFINFIQQDGSEIKGQITSVVEVLLKGICLLHNGNS
jgi:hypothetical protein